MDKVEVKKQQIIEQITQHMVQNGLADLGLRKLAAVAGTSDRMLIYYFETKDGLIGEVLRTVAANFTIQLDAVLGQHQRDANTLLMELLTLGESQQFNLIIQLWFEVVGLAARKQEPYAANATAIATSWLQWIESRLENPQVGEATALFAELEGRLMIKLLNVDTL
ncbi:MAG: TetR family transcriptional regulator [Chloroflexota bacterium]